MASQHTVLLTAAAGNIGSELVPQLLGAQMKLVLPTSKASRLQSKLPLDATTSNVAVEEGSIKDPVWVESILMKHNVDAVFLCLTGTDELIITLNFFDAIQRAGCVKHLVYLSACGDYVSDEGVKTLMKTCSAGHVVVKSIIEQKLAYGELPWKTTRIGPALFFSNDLRSKRSMLQDGVFDEPLGEKGVSRVATSDIALAIKNVILNSDKYAGKKIMIGSLRKFTGTEVAHLWSEAIGKEIKPWGTDEHSLNESEKEFEKKTGGKKDFARDMRLMYEVFSRIPFGMNEDEYKLQVEVLGKEAEDYVAWVKKTGATWR